MSESLSVRVDVKEPDSVNVELHDVVCDEFRGDFDNVAVWRDFDAVLSFVTFNVSDTESVSELVWLCIRSLRVSVPEGDIDTLLEEDRTSVKVLERLL